MVSNEVLTKYGDTVSYIIWCDLSTNNFNSQQAKFLRE